MYKNLESRTSVVTEKAKYISHKDRLSNFLLAQLEGNYQPISPDTASELWSACVRKFISSFPASPSLLYLLTPWEIRIKSKIFGGEQLSVKEEESFYRLLIRMQMTWQPPEFLTRADY